MRTTSPYFVGAAILLIVGSFFIWWLRYPISPPDGQAPGDGMTPLPTATAIQDDLDGNAPPPLATISAEALKKCMAESGGGGECLDRLFRAYLKNHSTVEALALINHYEETDTQLRLSCHPVVHAIGRETFRMQKTVDASFSACDQTCHSGCYHGAMERFLRGDLASGNVKHISAEEIKTKAAAACDPNQPLRFRFQCLHGLGHALVFFLDYRLREALAACEKSGDGWSQSSCFGGAFMENVFSATPAKRDLSSTDYHYPCSDLPEKYKNDCYMMQTTRMSEMGLSSEQLFAECRKAGNYANICIQSIGRDLSNDVRIGDPALVARKCELGTDPEREACTRGVVYALIDNTWDGKYAFPFCVSYTGPADATYCFTASVSYLRATFEKSPAMIAAECENYAPSSPLCREIALP